MMQSLDVLGTSRTCVPLRRTCGLWARPRRAAAPTCCAVACRPRQPPASPPGGPQHVSVARTRTGVGVRRTAEAAALCAGAQRRDGILKPSKCTLHRMLESGRHHAYAASDSDSIPGEPWRRMLPGTRGGEPVRAAGGGCDTAGNEGRSMVKVGDWAMEGLGSELVPAAGEGRYE